MKNLFKGKSKKAKQILQGIFFGKTAEQIQAEKQQKMEDLMASAVKYVPMIRDLLRSGNPTPGQGEQAVSVINEGQVISSLYNFYADYTGAVDQGIYIATGPMDAPMGMGFNTEPMLPQNAPVNQASEKIKATPKSVVRELELELSGPPVEGFLHDLDAKIELLKNKSVLSYQRFAKEQIDGLIERLENRKKYKEYESFFNLFLNTTDEKIEQLLSKYALIIEKEHLFIPTFPKEAIDVMMQYSQKVRELCGKDPVYYVIAEEKDFKKKWEKLDPILLVQSPFGFWWQVLGAWDKEMLLLSEL